MKIIHVLTAATVVLAACAGPGSDTFGRSYDECILKNARTGRDESSRETATDICERRFERSPTATELKDFEKGSSVRFNQISREMEFDGVQFTGMRNVKRDDVLVTIANLSRNVVVLEVETTITFFDRPRSESGEWPSDAKVVEILTWKLSPVAQPGEYGSATGGFDHGKAPSKFFSSKTKILRVLPLQ